MLATYRRLHHVTRLERTEGGDIYGSERRDRGIIGRERANASAIAGAIFPQMLRALNYLASEGIVHRDVKPENILYISQPGDPHRFQLGDFGLCNRVVDAVSFAGSRLYIPPEMFVERCQTHKVDVWSLFVTMLWILDAGEFRQRSTQFKYDAEVQRAASFAASNVDSDLKIQEMAIVNPEERASAAQMLVKHFDGGGLSTPRDRVPAPAALLQKSPPLRLRPQLLPP